ncbi:MAG: phospholipase [Planctomycetota bacterium]|nr:phospholipase [Planctomycetota bacterium]
MAVVEHELLRKLHRIHRQKSDLKSRIERGPRQLKATEKLVSDAEGAISDLKDSLKKTQLLANEKQLLLKQREDKILDFKGKLNAAKSNDEFQVLKNQIAADEKANEVLSDEILEQLEKIDETQSRIQQAGEDLQGARDEHKKVSTRVETETAGLQAELDRVQGELEESESRIPIDIKSDYSRVALSRGEESLAPLDGDFCGGCFQKITTMQHSDLNANKPVFCKTCGALIYLPESTHV